MKLDKLINNNYLKLTDSDLYILKYIMNNKKECLDLKINDLASKCNVSRTTILRFAQKIGFRGYSEFKAFLKWDIEGKKKIESKPVEKFYCDIEETLKSMQQKDFTEICKLIYNAERVFVYGTGIAQASVAREIKREFLSLQKCFYEIEGDTELKMLSPSFTPKDLIIIITLSGSREYLIDLVKELNFKGIKYIAITKINNNEVAIRTKYNIYVSTSIINLGNGNDYESMVLFSIAIEILFREYVAFLKTKETEK
ncbi:MurR/RpiR family transcriptional regulator [Caproiciproducens sp. MSJ-32]|uniref:MurR/RpiR family transcriptional regulator n=1 Tax=Caproiciproducens sp. MSJ-32 TaxID=2841527 RepID=UPI001C118396|nr:MurR/RpiR family transcriptional regulator [Caproiciproducens sp. MSJ-32]MBU5455836.1 MurR/RpiR family transcriptional regulator [Caproiciproducens sp. MSJ-32]